MIVTCFQNELQAAIEAIEMAAGLVKLWVQQGRFEKYVKESGEVVTELDFASDELLQQQLALRLPNIGYFSEETPEQQAINHAYWLVDPLDGTANATQGIDYFGISLALILDSKPALGVTKNVMTGDLYWAANGQGFWKNGARVGQACTSCLIEKALVSTGFAHDKKTHHSHLRVLQRLLQSVGDIRRFAAPTLDLCMLAEGKIHGVLEYLRPWDFAAGVVFLEEQAIQHNVSNVMDSAYFTDTKYFVAGVSAVYQTLLDCSHEGGASLD